MKINYDDSAKQVRCYRDYVCNPSDRAAARAFRKFFGENIMSAAGKLHDRLLKFDSAASYNAMYGASANRIELKKAVREKNPLVLKVRVDRSYRKFFNQVINDAGDVLLRKEWTGDFNSVTVIFVTDVNNHDYSN